MTDPWPYFLPIIILTFRELINQITMGRKKSPVQRFGRCGVNTLTSDASLSGLNVSNLLDDVCTSSLRGSTTINQVARASNTKSYLSVRRHLSGSLNETTLPAGEDTRRQRQGNRRKRRSSGDDVVVSRRDEAGDCNDERRQEEENEEEEEEMVTISVLELEKWQQRVIFHVEDHFSNEQLKRIAEFGRVHGSIVQEAKQYVSNLEMQLATRIEEERAALRAQAEEFVAKTTTENDFLRSQVDGLTQQVEGLEKKVETLEWQVDVLRSEVEPTHPEQDERQHEYYERVCQTHPQVQYERRETNKRVASRPSNDNHDANGYGSGSGCSSSTQQIAGNLSDHCCSSEPTNSTPEHGVCREKDQLLPLQHQPLQSSCNDESPTKILR